MKNIKETIENLAYGTKEAQEKACKEIAELLNENPESINPLLSVFTLDDLQEHLQLRGRESDSKNMD